MADVQLVETSLRDGNQCLWAALGIDTARTLGIAEVMDRVGFRAIDFTTSTHMGVAARYKKEDPWERIRLMAAATPHTPLQFMSTGFRFISWETASPDFMALAFQTLARNGIRRFCLADPMNDAESNMTMPTSSNGRAGSQRVRPSTRSISRTRAGCLGSRGRKP
jgi:oxaloacetate decarboxylase alpha subunit